MESSDRLFKMYLIWWCF